MATGVGSWADPAAVLGNASVIALLKGLTVATGGFAVTPHDVDSLAAGVRALYVGGAGDVKVTFVDGSAVTFVAVPAGSVLPFAVSKVWATGTTATGITALT